MRRLYLVYAFLVSGLYGTATWAGWELTPSHHGVVPANVRQGGYRSYSFWRGGK
jgi:hypothetical protein